MANVTNVTQIYLDNNQVYTCKNVKVLKINNNLRRFYSGMKHANIITIVKTHPFVREAGIFPRVEVCRWGLGKIS